MMRCAFGLIATCLDTDSYYDTTAATWIGGVLWDGKAYNTSIQAQCPPLNPNEMNNTAASTGSDPSAGSRQRGQRGQIR
jgi:cytochrome c peroxidase